MLVLVVGLTNSGKDTVAKYIADKYDLDFVVSHTTRPPRDYEINGVHHWFDTQERMDGLKNSGRMIAYTINEKTGIEYCATVEDVEGDKVYIINPNGIVFMQNSCPDISFISIYVDCEVDTIIERGIERGDDEKVLHKRLDSELDEFLTYKHSGEADYIIDNNGTKENLLRQVDGIFASLV